MCHHVAMLAVNLKMPDGSVCVAICHGRGVHFRTVSIASGADAPEEEFKQLLRSSALEDQGRRLRS